MRVKPHGLQVWGKKEKLGLGKCHLRKSFYFAILSINSFFLLFKWTHGVFSIIQSRESSTEHLPEQELEKKPFSSKIVLVLLRFAILPLQQCWPRPAGILPVIPFCKRSAKQKAKRRFINSMFCHQRSTVVLNTCHSFCRHRKKVFIYSPTKNYIFRKYKFLAGRIFQNFWMGGPCSIGRSFWLL